MKKKVKRNIVLVCPGGAMAGVFGSGVFTAFEKANLYPQIKTIYAGSAGALNAAYFLTRQTRLGASVYLDDLTEDKFIKPKYILLAYWQRLIKYIKKDPEKDLVSPIDLDYLFQIIKKGKKKLDIEKLLKSK